MSTAMLSEAEQKRDKMIREASADAQARVDALKQEIAEEERRLEAVRFQVDKELEAEQKRLSVGQEQLRAFIRDVRAVCNEELAQLELLPELPEEEPKAEPVIQVIQPQAPAPEEAAPAAAEPEGVLPPEVEKAVEEAGISHEDLLQAISAFAADPAVPAGPVEDPFAEDELEDDSDPRIMKLDELQFGPNYKKD